MPFLLRNFNSIKVQLEPGSIFGGALGLLFQFHKGTIRTIPIHNIRAAFAHFNSIKVQLELFL